MPHEYCPTCDPSHGPLCDFCQHHDFNGDKDGAYTGDGYCRKYGRAQDPCGPAPGTCDSFRCFQLPKEGDRPKCFGIPARLDDCRKTPDACAVFDYCLDAADAKQKPTFKVGDKVRVRDDYPKSAYRGVVVCDECVEPAVQMEDGKAFMFCPSDLALADPVPATLPNPNEPGYVEPCQHGEEYKVYSSPRVLTNGKMLRAWYCTRCGDVGCETLEPCQHEKVYRNVAVFMGDKVVHQWICSKCGAMGSDPYEYSQELLYNHLVAKFHGGTQSSVQT